MKTLLTTILILFTINLIGQNDTIHLKFKDDSVISARNFEYLKIGATTMTVVDPYYKDLIISDPKPVKQYTVITDQLLFEYETDCFNDSTAHYYYSVSDMFESWEVQCNKGDTTIFGGICPEHWHHEEPTFKGFIKWLKQK